MRLFWLAGLAALTASGADLAGLFPGGNQHPAIQYPTLPARDRVSELSRRIQQGNVRLRFDARHGYLPSLLEALRIPVESQMLVYSKTSVQAHLISPQNPRAL